MPWQITKILSDEGKILFQIKIFFKNPKGGYTFKKYHALYCDEDQWEKFKRWIKKSKT